MKKRFAWMGLLALVLAVIFGLPNAANADVAGLLTLLKTITSTLRSDIGLALGTIRTTKAAIRNLEQLEVWPEQMINEARGLAISLRAQYTGGARQIFLLSLNSATQPNTVQLESIIRGGQTGGFSQLAVNYSQVFAPVPRAQNARANDRNVMDADDATALAALKRGMAADQSTQSTLRVADVLEREAAKTAPGAVPLLLAQAQATELENEATLHRLLAAELREEAARLAHRNTLRKRHADANVNLRIGIQQLLTR